MVDSRLPTVMKHNPGFLAAEELIASFIARRAEFESLLEIVHNNDRKANQHVLVIGRRGMGKTMLVHRLALAIEQDPALSKRWYPLLFGEEAYGVSTAGELWLEALHQLATQTGEARWRETHAALRRERDERRLHDLALARLLEFADERGVRLMIAVENLQDILGVQMSEAEGWTLRHTLLNEPRIMLLATATNRFDDIDKPQAATYEMFRVIQLRALEREECRVIWERLTGERLEGRRIRPIEIVTGGNPRLLTILGGFAQGRSLREFMADLLGLVDDHSDYFKSNIEALSLEERRAFTALCELWEPSPARAVAEVARFDVNKTSMLLGRLANRGAVEIVRVHGRTQYYQVCERLYNLFHRLRRNSTRDNRAASVVEFMARFYSPEEIPELAKRIAAEICQDDSPAREDLGRVLGQLSQKAQVPPTKLFSAFPAEFWKIPETKDKSLPWRDYLDIRRMLGSAIITAHDGSILESEFDEADVPVVRLCNRAIADDITHDEFVRGVTSHLESTSHFILAVAIMVALAKGILNERELGTAEDQWLESGFMVPLFWSIPTLKNFAMRRWLAALDEIDEDSAVMIGSILIERCRESRDWAPFDTFLERARAHAAASAIHRRLGKSLEPHDLDRAESAYRAALATDPDDLRALGSLIDLLLAAHRLAEAEALSRDSWTRHPGHISALNLLLKVLLARKQPDTLFAVLSAFFAEPAQIDFSLGLAEDWFIVVHWAVQSLDRDAALVVARGLAARFDEIESPRMRAMFIGALSSSPHVEVVRVAIDADARVGVGHPEVHHVVFALRTESVEQAFDVLESLARANPASLRHLLDVHRETLMQLALADPERLHRVAATLPLFEPLAVALALELGLDVNAPHEVGEIASDIREELRRRRGPSYAVEVPVFAAAEERPHRPRKTPTRRKPAKPRKH
ncbi:AAA family ATPase [Nannocystaceae bacterium ST9]